MIDQILMAGTGDDVPDLANLIGGEWRTASEQSSIPVVDPTRADRPVARVPAMSPGDVTRAWDAAADAAPAWSGSSPIARGRILSRATARIRELRDPIARVVTCEMGKTLAEAAAETNRCADFFEYYAQLAREPQGELLADERPGVSAWTIEEPVGLVLAITPWNDPLATPARKLAPALIAGNTVVLKPATQTPLSALILGAILNEAGLPAGVLNTVTGHSSTIEAPLLGDPRLAAVTFTGSTEVGLMLHRRLAARNVRLETEMGGKNAAVILADADLELAAKVVAEAAFNQSGQRCTATSRVIVHRAARDRFVALLIDAAARLRVGSGVDESTTMGPLASVTHGSSVRALVNAAVHDGATVLFADGRESPQGACFVSPTILEVSSAMAIWRQEVFGPVIAIVAVDSFDAAVDAANDSEYGLAASVFTQDLAAAHRFIRCAQAGQVSVNLPTSGWDVHQPFGGWKQSGSPFREHGKHGLRFYTRVKNGRTGPRRRDLGRAADGVGRQCCSAIRTKRTGARSGASMSTPLPTMPQPQGSKLETRFRVSTLLRTAHQGQQFFRTRREDQRSDVRRELPRVVPSISESEPNPSKDPPRSYFCSPWHREVRCHEG
jgi:acyl-CoA reductase-like NAD-dependent aldehyde dehydrogenase